MGRSARHRQSLLQMEMQEMARLQAAHPHWFRVVRAAAIIRLTFTAPLETITLAERMALWALIFYTLGRFIF